MKDKRKQINRKQWKALLYKDLCDLRWNGQILVLLITGIILIFLFAMFPNVEIPISFLLAFVFGVITMVMQGNLIVEEREQRTILRLEQVGISWKAVILSKMLVTFMTTALLLIIFLIFYGGGFFFSLQIFILAFPIVIIMLVAGTFLGIKTKNTIEISLFGMPIILLYFFVEGLLMNSNQGDMLWLAIFPNYHLHYGISQLESNEPFLSYLAVPFIWLAAVMIIFVSWYKTRNFN